MTRATLLEAVRLKVQRARTSPLASEIEHFMSLDDREYAYDEVSALFDAYDLAERETKDRKVINAARDLLIVHGFYRVMSADEQANTFTSSGRAPYDFRLGGTAYTSDPNTVDGWQWPDEA